MAARRLSLTAAGMLCAWGLLLASASTPAVANTLPDGRAYEMVSPVDKNGGQIDGGVTTLGPSPPQQAAEDGEAVTFGSQAAFGGAEGGLETEQYLARRGPGGWVTEPVTPAQDPPVSSNPLFKNGGNIVQGSDANSLYQDFTPDLAHGFLVASDPAPVVGAPADYFMPYERDMGSGAYRLLAGSTPAFWGPGIGSLTSGGIGFDIGFAGSSADGSHVIFAANDALTPEAVPGHFNLYEAVGGAIRLVSILPDGSPDQGEFDRLLFGQGEKSIFSGKYDEAPFGGNFQHAISSDGSRIFWTGSDRQLYMRENGTVTIDVSASQKTNGAGTGGTDPGGPRKVDYQGANASGSVVLFTSTEQLTNDSTAVTPNAPDLYRYDTETGELADLTVDHQASDPNGAEVEGVLGASEDGSYVYFAANGALAQGATYAARDKQTGNFLPNVYAWHNGTLRFIAQIKDREDGEYGVGRNQPWESFLPERTSRVSPNGRYLAFESRLSLTGYDNRDVASGRPDMEVYRYDAATGTLVCASCDPGGARPNGSSTIPDQLPLVPIAHRVGWQTAIHQQRYLLDDGRLFFNSGDALVPQDTNGVQDVYEYEDGRVWLISSGTGEEAETHGAESQFVDASASGSDVFFVTRDQLVSQDVDEALDLYDARVNGGFPRLSAPACAGTGCQGVPPAPPIFATPASVTFNGVGNFMSESSRAVKKAKGTHRSKRRSKHRHKAKKPNRHAARKHG